MENLHAVSHFNTKYLVLWTTPKTLEPPWRNRLKERRIRSGLHSRIVEFSRVKYFHTFVSSLNCVPPIGANTDKRRWSCHEGLDRTFDLCCQRTIRSESTRDKAGSLPPASRDYFMLFVIFFFFYVNWIPKIMVQFCYLRLYFGIDIVSRRLLQWIARIENGLKLRPTTRYIRTYSNKKSTRLIQIMKVTKKVTLK